MTESERNARNLVDAEYDNLVGCIDQSGLFDYLSDFPECEGLTREESDDIFNGTFYA